MDNGVYKHQCLRNQCQVIVEYDDEPYCFVHSPNEGSSVPGFSARAILNIALLESLREQV